MRFVSVSLLFLSSFALVTGCSDKGSSSSVSTTSEIEGWVGAQGLNNAQVVINQIAESGQVSLNDSGIYLGKRESTDAGSRFTATVKSDETVLLIARGQIADVDKDRDNLATQRQCQLADGCSDLDPKYKFSDFYPATEGFEWRSVIYTAGDDSRNNVNAITTLAAAFAYKIDVKYGYDNHASHDHTGFENVASDVFANDIFTPYDVVLANSQTANVLGLQDIIGDLPANLTQLNNFNANTAAARNQIRYGALLAGLQALELTYLADPSNSGSTDFISRVAEQFAEDSGQLYKDTPSPSIERALTQKVLYQSAHDNLESIAVTVANTEAKAAVNAVVAELAEQILSIAAEGVDAKTTEVADELSLLLTAGEFTAFNLGLEKTKLFVNDLLTFQQTFWQSDYQTELDGYLDLLRSIGDEHSENLDGLATEFARIQAYYVNCKIMQPAAGECTQAYTPDASDPEDRNGLVDIAGLSQTYNDASKVLTLNSGTFASGIAVFKKVTVSQKIADINLVDNNDNPTRSHAIDIFITGELEKGNLVLTLAHKLDSADEVIEIPSSMRIYYNQEVSGVPTTAMEIQGYELIWGEFQLYDKSKLGVDYDANSPELGAEIELSGAFRIFYRGLRDPKNLNIPNNSDLRFNIENWALSSVISDKMDDDAGTDRESSTLIISGSSSNADSYYPAQKRAKFDGFFTANNTNAIGDEIAELLTYRVDQESVRSGSRTITVQTIDFESPYIDDIRYRFYPNERVVDENDSDGDGDYTEVVDMHRIEECKLNDSGQVKSCGSKTKVYDKVNVQKTINEFWEIGLFQRVPVDGDGTYIVDFPTTKNGQCFELSPLADNNAIPMKGTLVEQQVLGLDSLRLLTEIKIEDVNNLDLPKTLLDITVVAPTQDKYRVTAGLSHNYSSTATDNSGIVLGSGTSASSLLISYDTSGDFENAGNISIAKGGVTLTLADGTVVSEDQDITAFLSQRYSPNNINYKIIEDAEGQPNRCVTSVDHNTDAITYAEQVFYLNYRDVIYATIRPEGDNGIWTIRYIDGSWMVPSSVPADVQSGD
ncbi:MAG: hypothetical protein KBT75_07490 [Oleispira antarctica]|nr:hypothetical protein [Oleispira antarctica]MBQ0792392.1 hypothetical protein [Oleispira antarctica]